MIEHHDSIVMDQDICLRDTELEVQHVQEFAFDPPHIAFIEESGAERPMDVL